MPNFFSQQPNFMATLAGLSSRGGITLTGGQINASKISYRPILKASIQIL